MANAPAIGLLIALALAAGPASATGAPDARTLDFDVLREGTPIGTHRVTIRDSGARTEVEIAIDLEVRFAFLTLYRYTHRARETWEAGRLAALEAATDDDGTRTRVAARAVADGLAVEGSGGNYVAPADTFPTSYWRQEKVARTHLLDTQSGRLVAVRNTGLGVRDTPVGGVPVPVRFFRLDGDLAAEIGYAADGSWAALAFAARGSRIDYVRRSPSVLR